MQLINDVKSRINEIAVSGYAVKIEKYLTDGFSIFRKKPEFFLIYAAIYLAAMPFGGFLLSYPLTAGFFIAAWRIDSGRQIYFEHFFDGFRYFVQLTLLMIVQGFIIIIGFIFFIIPGIYLMVAYCFTPLLVVFAKMDFMEAMSYSKMLVRKEWFGIFGLMLILGLVNFIGVLAFGVGILFTLPITFCAMYAAFKDITGPTE